MKSVSDQYILSYITFLLLTASIFSLSACLSIYKQALERIHFEYTNTCNSWHFVLLDLSKCYVAEICFYDKDLLLKHHSIHICISWSSNLSNNVRQFMFSNAECGITSCLYIVGINRDGLNCEELSENLQVAWIVSGDSITIDLAGNIGMFCIVQWDSSL